MAKDKNPKTLIDKAHSDSNLPSSDIDVKDHITNMKLRESLGALGESPRKISDKFL